MKPILINFPKTCDHQRTVDDVSTGDLVCTDCGLVLDQIYLPRTKTHLPISMETNRLVPNQEITDTIDRMCDKCNIDDENVKRNILLKWQNFESEMNGKHGCLESSVLMCIYTALIESKVPRPLNHLCALTNVNMNKVRPYLKDKDSFYRPNLMCEYFLHSLNLSYKDVEEIKEMVKLLENKFVFSQKTLIASCAYIFLRKSKHDSHKRITKSQLAKQLGISAMAIYRCIKKINHQKI